MNQEVFNKTSEQTTNSLNEETGMIAEQARNVVSQEADTLFSDSASKSIFQGSASTVDEEAVHMTTKQANSMISERVDNVPAEEANSTLNAAEGNTESEEITNRTTDQQSKENDKDVTNKMSDDYESEPERLRKLFFGGLSFNSTEESLKSHFEQWGEVTDCIVKRDPSTKRSKCFGFITYKKAHMIDDAQSARPHYIDGRKVDTKRAMPREDSGKPEVQIKVNTLFVKNLKEDIETDNLVQYFGKYGKIKKANIATDKSTGRKRGFAFIEFDDYDPVDKIILLRQHFLKGNRVQIQKALPKTDKESFTQIAAAPAGAGIPDGYKRGYNPSSWNNGSGYSGTRTWTNRNGHGGTSSWNNGNVHSATSSWSNGYTTPAHFAGNSGADYGSTSGGGAIRHSATSSGGNGNGHSATSSWSNGYTTPAHFAGNSGADYGSTSGGGAIRHSATSSGGNGNGHSVMSSWSNGYTAPAHFAGNSGADYGCTSGGGAIRSNRFAQRSQGPYGGGVNGENSLGYRGVRW